MPPLKFDPEASVEEIAGIGRHAAFDAVIDDKDDDAFQVVCRRADGTEIPLAKPARAFYFDDRVLYDEEAKRFDRVLEKAYEKSGKAFVEKTTGRGPAGSINAFYRAIPAGDRHLLKLHGNLTNAAERVLNKAEYDDACGNDGNIHFDRPVPKLLNRLYTSFSFLFLGCSLSFDRTIQTFTKIAQDVGANSLPHHYAILACPADNDRKTKLEQRLADQLKKTLVTYTESDGQSNSRKQYPAGQVSRTEALRGVD